MRNQSCPKTECMYLHHYGDPDASFTKEDMQVSVMIITFTTAVTIQLSRGLKSNLGVGLRDSPVQCSDYQNYYTIVGFVKAGKHQEYEKKLLDEFNTHQNNNNNNESSSGGGGGGGSSTGGSTTNPGGVTTTTSGTTTSSSGFTSGTGTAVAGISTTAAIAAPVVSGGKDVKAGGGASSAKPHQHHGNRSISNGSSIQQGVSYRFVYCRLSSLSFWGTLLTM